MAENYKTREERRRKQAPVKKKTKGKRKNIFKTILLTIFLLGIAGLAVGATTFAIYAKDAPPLDEVLLIDPIASEVLDMNDNVYAVLGTENRDYVDYDHIPKEVEDAVLATEDVRFYKHGGIDLRRLAGAVVANVSRGFGSEGASTITQQIVKLSYLSTEKSLKRKAQEAWLAIKLEQNYTKEQIFEIYVNKIYYANGVHGIETASKYYFGKNLDELALQERAFLAGLPQRPGSYDPYVHPDNADKRKNLVLSLMYQHGKISKDEMDKAKETSILETLIPEEENKGTAYKYDSFVDEVIREVESLGNYNVYADGLKIHTTLDPNAQDYTEKMLLTDEVIEFPDAEMQAGIVLLDTKTGAVRAIGGNRYKDIKRGRNFATKLSDRQPGSTIKPILDYGPAIEYLNWSTYEQIVDEPYQYSTGQPINNYDNAHLGQMSMREALYRSRNIPALKAFEAVGNEKAREFAANVGLEYEKIDNPSASIGGIENISPLKLAGAYAAFGNNGMYNKPHTVHKIVLKDGETEIVNKIKPKVAMKDSTAFMVTDMLKDVLSNKSGATGGGAIIPGLPAAGKTGTTNYSEEDMEKYGVKKGDVPDAWFAGYTTNYTAAVWTGYEKRSTPLRGGWEYNDQKIAQQLYKNLMAHVSEGIETPDFTMPSSVVKAAVEKGSMPAKKPSSYTPDSNIVYELFVAGTEPTQVSAAFDKLDSPTVTGEYQEDENSVTFTWGHAKEKDLKFEVTIKAGDKKQSIGSSNGQSYTITNVQPETTYSIEVIAVSNSQRSTPGTASVTVPKIEEEEEAVPPEEDEAEEDKEKDKEKEKENKKDEKDKENNGSDEKDGNKDDGSGGAEDGSDNGGNDDPGNNDGSGGSGGQDDGAGDDGGDSGSDGDSNSNADRGNRGRNTDENGGSNGNNGRGN
ncbi:penicillin-binding protein 1A [Lederbergia citrea]|uniref:PBP1A family penicillin-binding protein n=1 Tax=Lederbergia citrea TaxID=2833581 RepID=A0A942UIM6_9BACI|nr:penicillin-binding protein 1A [Lederbergia citrea]MBS4222171.1 PBP1A family penicillin-binding protein [Lederbergia citrea]